MLVLAVDPRTSVPLAETVVPEFWFFEFQVYDYIFVRAVE